jgi:hypothetical protein
VISYHLCGIPSADENLQAMIHTLYDQIAVLSMSLLYRAHPETVVSHHGCACERGAGNSAQCAHRGIDAANSRFPLESQRLIRHARLTHLGLDVIDEAELIDYRGQCPRTRVLDSATGSPNARYWRLKVLWENFPFGDKLWKRGSFLRELHKHTRLTL